MIKNHILFSIFLLISPWIFSQQTIGLFLNSPESFNGYTLFGPQDSKETYLIDNCGEKVHSWTSQYKPGLSSYLLEDGTLLRTGRIIGMGGGSGIVEMLDWNSNVIWSHSVSSTHGRQHHDIELLPNGNILLIVWDNRSQAEVTQAGSSTSNAYINSEQIIEIQPDIINGGASVVWEWKAWDHLIQDADVAKDHYGVIADHPERVNINFLNHNSTDWLHFNGVDYNDEFDQIIISVHNFSEFWIIDHSTTTAEAADTTGGTYGQGGDILYRWGNPQAYDQGTPTDQKLFLQHHTHWIPDSYPNAGRIILFNNQAGTPQGQNYSAVNILELPVNINGFYTYTGGAYGPSNFDWTYQAPTPTDFYSNILSGVQRLENGNTLICEGVGGRFFEIDTNETIVWEYINPVNDLGPQVQETSISDNNTFRCTRYATNYPGLIGKALSPQGYIETGSTFSCDLYPAGVSGHCNATDIYANDSTNAFCFDTINQVRKCYTNDIPDHVYGPFGGMGAIAGQEFDYSMCLYPDLDTLKTHLFEDTTLQGCGGGIIFGVSNIGVNYSPFARLYFVNPNTLEENLNFHEEAVFTLNMDINGGHVNVLGRYHYHSAPIDYIANDLNIDGSEHSPVLGYAADGFPIYYKYLFTNALDSNSAISGFQSSYSLKSGNRTGDGISAPSGAYDGTYYEDYEYIPLQSDLDECGGRYAKTPEYPNGTYYYVLTDNWPYIPRCFKGKFPDNSFRIGPNCPASSASTDCSNPPNVSVNIIQTQIEMNVYPNPASTLLKINIEDNLSNKVKSLVIYNSTAQTVYSSRSFKNIIQIGNLPKGIYFVQLDFEKDQITKKVIIK
ncbi:MAG TPA: YHYH protein [Flavobacteriales bacterium]|nr:YHYH protein [Flavobacteriales bacterium]